MTFRFFSLVAIVALIFSTVSAITYDLSRGTDSVADSVIKALNRSIDPCTNFYQFACGGWLNDAVIPDDESRYTRSFSNIEKHNSEILANIMRNTTDPMISTFFSSCMNTSAIESRGVLPAISMFQAIENLIAKDAVVASTMAAVAHHHKFQITNFFEIVTGTDPGNPEINIAQLSQGGLKIPRSIYAKESSDLFIKYKEHAAKMFKLVGYDAYRAEMAIRVELALSKIFQSDEELDDPFSTYNKMSFNQLQKRYPKLAFDAYVTGLGVSFQNVNVISVEYFDKLNDLINDFDSDSMISYLQWSALHSIATYMNEAVRDEHFNYFGKILRGEESQQDRVRQCVSSADESIGFLVGKYFVQESFPQEAKDLNIRMIKEVEKAFEGVVKGLEWMDTKTKNAALLKLSQVVDRVGYPDVWPSYEGAKIEKDYFLNKLSFRYFEMSKVLKSFDKPVDRNIWEMTPSTVNAYYEPTSNSINFPAGILYNPYFSLEFPIEMNYGGVGLIMGHELSHGFDNHGRLYDGKGKLENWWSKESGEKFEENAQCLVEQYSGFCPIEGHCVNGKLTLGENIADNAGLKEAFLALQATIGDEEGKKSSIVNFLTRYQLFFTAFAQGWCTKAREAEIIRRLETDVHSPPDYRVIGTIENSPFFGEVFQCPVGSPMNPEKKCTIF